MGWIRLAQDASQCQSLVNKVIFYLFVKDVEGGGRGM
jgi:hypothetical protein